jgi:hypothetical protein
MVQREEIKVPRKLNIQILSFFLRLEKRRDLGCATRNATPQVPCTEPAWALQSAKAIGQKCEKP